MNNIIVSAEEAINRLTSTTLGDIGSIRYLKSRLAQLDDDDNELDIESLTPEKRAEYDKRSAEERAKILEGLKRKGRRHKEALQPITILIGDSSMIHDKVMKPFVKRVLEDEHYGYDLEFRNIHSFELTKDFVSSLPKPTGKDGGVLVISDFSTFTETYNVDDQETILKNVMRTYCPNPVSTGWRIIFIENTKDKNKWWPYSCVQHFQGCLDSFYVE